jgi:large conductance mechanosensitive channel
MKSIIEEFKAFILKGNVVQLAVAVIIGAAFSDVVKSVQEDLISPILGSIGGKPDFSFITMGPIRIGSFLNSILSFLITAAVIFFVIVKPMNRFMRLVEKKDPSATATPPPATLDDVVTAIKELRQQVAGPGSAK